MLLVVKILDATMYAVVQQQVVIVVLVQQKMILAVFVMMPMENAVIVRLLVRVVIAVYLIRVIYANQSHDEEPLQPRV